MGRTPCCDKNGLKKGPWTPEEDQKLMDYIQINGYGNWRTLPKNAGLQRCGKSCRLRWTNYLRPDIKRGRFSFEEEETIIQLHSILGNKWSAIAARIPGRTDNEIKNYWNTHIRKRLLRMGIDPVTHCPRLDLLDLSTILNSSLCNATTSSTSAHLNFSRLLEMQPLINPQLIRLATSLFSSSSHRQTQGFIMPNTTNYAHNLPLINNNNNNTNTTPQTHNPNINPSSSLIQPAGQIQDLTVPTTCVDATTNSVPLSNYNHDQASRQLYDCVEQRIPQILSEFDSQNIQGINDHWQQENGMPSTLSHENYVPLVNYGYADGCNHQSTLQAPTPSSETLTFHDSNSSNNFSFQSVLSNISTPSSSSTPLHSNSNYINSSSTDQDEKESYCSNILKFEIQDIFNDFM